MIFIANTIAKSPTKMWTEHFTLQELTRAHNTNKGVYLRGKTPNGYTVWGEFAGSFGGICLLVRLGNTTQRIINDFAYSSNPPSSTCTVKPEALNLESPVSRILSPWTIHFWLNSGYTTKPYLTTDELQKCELLDPMSPEGLARWVKPAPFLEPIPHILSHIRATKTDLDYFQPDDAEYFMETGELLPHEEGHMAPKPIASRIATKKNEQLNEWHLARALKANEGAPGRNDIQIGSGNYSTHYRFDHARHVLHVIDKNPHRELIFQVRLPTFPSSTVPSAVASPVAGFILRPAPEMPPMSPISTMGSLVDDVPQIHRPKPIRAESYTDLIVGLSETALDEEKYAVEKNLVEAGQKLQKILNEEERRHNFSEKVSRLTSAQITEGLEVHHRTMKVIYRRGVLEDLTAEDDRALFLAEEWCLAAYDELRKRR